MGCSEMTKEELVERFASDWGFGRDVTEQFTLEQLRAACESNSPITTSKVYCL